MQIFREPKVRECLGINMSACETRYRALRGNFTRARDVWDMVMAMTQSSGGRCHPLDTRLDRQGIMLYWHIHSLQTQQRLEILLRAVKVSGTISFAACQACFITAGIITMRGRADRRSVAVHETIANGGAIDGAVVLVTARFINSAVRTRPMMVVIQLTFPLRRYSEIACA